MPNEVNAPILEAAAPTPAPPAEAAIAGIRLADIPRPNLATLMILQKIDSPFTRMPVDEHGLPAFDEAGQPTSKARPVIPTLEEVAQTLYVLLNQNNLERVRTLIADPEAFDRAVLDFASKIDLSNIGSFAQHISGMMAEVNAASADYNMRGTEGNA